MKNKYSLDGLHTALITPFHSDGSLNEEGLIKNLRFQLENEVDGIVALGTTGEAPTLSHKESKRVIEICAKEVKGKALFMVGTGSYSTQHTIENTLQAAELGADIALVVSPYYNKPTQEGLFRHFKALAEISPIPILIYNIQGRTGQNIQTETLLRLVSLPNIIGVKEASGNVSQMSDVIEKIGRHHPHFKILSGDDGLTMPMMALGGHGVISVASNLVPKEVKKLVQAMLKGELKDAQEKHFELMPLFRALFIETNPIPIKAAMHSLGMPAGSCRLPLCDLSPHNLNHLKTTLDQFFNR